MHGGTELAALLAAQLAAQRACHRAAQGLQFGCERTAAQAAAHNWLAEQPAASLTHESALVGGPEQGRGCSPVQAAQGLATPRARFLLILFAGSKT